MCMRKRYLDYNMLTSYLYTKINYQRVTKAFSGQSIQSHQNLTASTIIKTYYKDYGPSFKWSVFHYRVNWLVQCSIQGKNVKKCYHGFFCVKWYSEWLFQYKENSSNPAVIRNFCCSKISFWKKKRKNGEYHLKIYAVLILWTTYKYICIRCTIEILQTTRFGLQNSIIFVI